MSKSTDFDVIVLGAGPAGCAAAIHAARAGLQVALIEREPFPRDRPGEALHPDVDPLFAQLGLGDAISEAGFIRYPGWLLERQGSQDFVPFSAGPASVRFGYQAWRADLDALLLEAVRRAGARILQPCAAEAVAASDGRVTGVRATSMDLRCRQLIDASGNFQWLARKLRLEVKSVSPRLVARYGYFAGDCGVGVLPIFREDVDGWTWIAKVKNECCQWVRLSFSGSERDSVLPPPFDRLPRAAPVRGANVAWRCVWDCAGPGYFLCGDAAAILDPAASRGVIRALTSGLKAADCAALIVKGEVDEAAALPAYSYWVRERFATEGLELCARYARFPNPPVWLEEAESACRELLRRAD